MEGLVAVGMGALLLGCFIDLVASAYSGFTAVEAKYAKGYEYLSEVDKFIGIMAETVLMTLVGVIVLPCEALGYLAVTQHSRANIRNP